ncbi:MAG: phosphoribosylformylglycinamidine synthase [Bdellovibrionales bacterium]|nr:phosphoribosylformylglycinamidine synthase [Bdellovibrionales bacterium]
MATYYFRNKSETFGVLFASAEAYSRFTNADFATLAWLLGTEDTPHERVKGTYVGPRREILSPWSTNATEIMANVGLSGIARIERFAEVADGEHPSFDPMLEEVYVGLSEDSLDISQSAEPLRAITDIAAYNTQEGLALSAEEIAFLEQASATLGRPLTDAEVYGFSQINSEHCRHKIFNGTFVIDGKEQQSSLFSLIKDTSKASPDLLVSAYKDNVAFIEGPRMLQFAPADGEKPSGYRTREVASVISLKAETHNFPTTVEPFMGASTGSGGEIRDRMAGGIGSIPLGGSAVYMTAYPRLQGGPGVHWEKHTKPRDWKYQTPQQILTKASNGASDFGNKFGHPLIVGSVLTYEGKTPRGFYGYDRTIMLAGGIGYAHREHAQKREPQPGDAVVLLGGDNYRIGMAGGSVSSVDTGAVRRELELSAVQRSNPEMQKRVYNVIRSLVERSANPIIMIHDHGAGGHINCLTELLESQGGVIELDKLPVGDPTLSPKELICNESQERMGLIVRADDVALLRSLADRERAPCYVIGHVTGDKRIVFRGADGQAPVDLPLEVLLGSSPKLVLEDEQHTVHHRALEYAIADGKALRQAFEAVLSLEGVACKDWLTNKVDRCVTGLVAQQQCVGPLQLPLSNVGVMAFDYEGRVGAASAIGHAPIAGLIDEAAGSVLSVAESLTNIVWAPLKDGLRSVVLSANWMWPAKQPGENARLYRAVEALSEFCVALGIPVPTGKDSLSMTMKYEDGQTVRAPGTVVVSAAAECVDAAHCITPDLKAGEDTVLVYIDLSGERAQPLGGSSFAQSLGQLGDTAPTVRDAQAFAAGFELLQKLVKEGLVLAGHDVSSGGLITAVAEMAFAGDRGVDLSISGSELDVVPKLFCEKPAVVLQVKKDNAPAIRERAEAVGLSTLSLGEVRGTQFRLHAGSLGFSASVAELRRVWFKPSYLLDSKQTAPSLAEERYRTFDAHPLTFSFPQGFTGQRADLGINFRKPREQGPWAAVVREKGTNGEREMAACLYAAGFQVRDVCTSDLVAGRETLEGVQFVVFPGGFSNSDVLGAAHGWAGVFRYHEQARAALQRFIARPDTLTLGVCNGCQLLVDLDLPYPDREVKVRMLQNESQKFESSFVAVRVEETASVMLKPLVGSRLGIWVAHGEGRFSLPEAEESYDIPLKYVSVDYPANPNGSDYNAAAVCSPDGRHLVMMPHLERSMFSWNWPYRGKGEVPPFEVSPWILAFTAAREWVEQQST